jgi:hypothetical protein
VQGAYARMLEDGVICRTTADQFVQIISAHPSRAQGILLGVVGQFLQLEQQLTGLLRQGCQHELLHRRLCVQSIRLPAWAMSVVASARPRAHVSDSSRDVARLLAPGSDPHLRAGALKTYPAQTGRNDHPGRAQFPRDVGNSSTTR